MGVTWFHEVYVVCDGEPTKLQDRCSDVPVFDQVITDNVLHFNSGGYGIFPLFMSEFELPTNWVKISHRISPCQGQQFDVVDWVSKTEIDELYHHVDRDEDGEYEYEPGDEYTDPDSDYWEENSQLNLYNTQPDEIDDDTYQEWYDNMVKTQQQDLIKGIR